MRGGDSRGVGSILRSFAAGGRRGTVRLFLTAVLAGFFPHPVAGQPSADIGVSVEVLPSLTVSGERPLQFGKLVVASSRRTLPADAALGGRWRIDGAPGEEVVLSFALPGALAGPDGTSLPVEFGTADAVWSADPAGQGGTALDPHQGTSIVLPERGRVYLLLGGTVKTGEKQRPGTYTGKATLSVSYLRL